MARIGIYLPKYYRPVKEDVLKPMDEAVVRKELIKLAKLMTDLCGGCTSQEVTGYYKFSDGFFSEAPTIELYCFCSDKEVARVSREIKPLLVDVRLRLAQNSIGMYINNKFVEL